MELKNLIRPHLREIQPYSSARDEFSGDASVFLDANENAIGSTSKGAFNRYPDPNHTALKSKWSELNSLPESQIFFGNGSDEPIDLLMRLFCEPHHDSVITMPPTYGMYQVSAAINGIKNIQVPLKPDFQINTVAVKESIRAGSKLLFICSPNNPSGNLLHEQDVREILTSFKGLVVIDEAYIDFTKGRSWLSEIDQFPNLVVLQTLSKAWGMAAIRVGVAMGHPYVISMLEKIKPPYNISLANQDLALQALNRKQLQLAYIAELRNQRSRLKEQLEKLKIVEKVFPSDANFLLVRFKDAAETFRFLLDNEVIVRDRSGQLHCHGCLRITVGTQDENNRLLALLQESY